MKMEHFWDEDKRENIADHAPSHSSPAHLHSSLHCSAAVSVSRWDWVQGQSSQALQFFCVKEVRLLLWFTHMLLPPPVCWVLWELAGSRHPAPVSSGSDTASLSALCKTDSALTAERFVLSRRDLSRNLKSSLWNVIKICRMRCLV